MCQYCNDSLIEVKMFLSPKKMTQLPQKLTQKDIVKWKYKVYVVISPVTATMGKNTEVHLWIHTLDMLLSGYVIINLHTKKFCCNNEFVSLS